MSVTCNNPKCPAHGEPADDGASFCECCGQSLEPAVARALQADPAMTRTDDTPTREFRMPVLPDVAPGATPPAAAAGSTDGNPAVMAQMLAGVLAQFGGAMPPGGGGLAPGVPVGRSIDAPAVPGVGAVPIPAVTAAPPMPGAALRTEAVGRNVPPAGFVVPAVPQPMMPGAGAPLDVPAPFAGAGGRVATAVDASSRAPASRNDSSLPGIELQPPMIEMEACPPPDEGTGSVLFRMFNPNVQPIRMLFSASVTGVADGRIATPIDMSAGQRFALDCAFEVQKPGIKTVQAAVAMVGGGDGTMLEWRLFRCVPIQMEVRKAKAGDHYHIAIGNQSASQAGMNKIVINTGAAGDPFGLPAIGDQAASQAGMNRVIAGGEAGVGQGSQGVVRAMLDWFPVKPSEFEAVTRDIPRVMGTRKSASVTCRPDRLCLDIRSAGAVQRLFVFARAELLFGRASREVQGSGKTYRACDVVLRFAEHLPEDRERLAELQSVISRNACTLSGGLPRGPVLAPLGAGAVGGRADDLDVAVDGTRRLRLRLTPLAAIDPKPWAPEGFKKVSAGGVGADQPGAFDGAWVRRDGDLESHSYLALFRRVLLGGASSQMPLLGAAVGGELYLAALHGRLHASPAFDTVWTLNGQPLLYREIVPLCPGDVLSSAVGEIRVLEVQPERFVEAAGT